jgi:hypothetical protein
MKMGDDVFEELKEAVEDLESKMCEEWKGLAPHERTYIKGRVRMMNGIVRDLKAVTKQSPLPIAVEEDGQ